MEDRITAGLYLEMTDRPATAEATDCHPALRIMYVNTFRRLGEHTA